MVHFLFLYPTAQDKKLKGYLVEELHWQITPLLESLQFKVFRPRQPKDRGFPTKYYRETPERIDVIVFWWRSNGTPAFIIDFDVIDEVERFTSPAKAGSETWFNAPRYRANARIGMYERWFHIGYLPRLGFSRVAARREVQKAKRRIIEIDIYAKGGKASSYFHFHNPGGLDRMPERTRLQ